MTAQRKGAYVRGGKIKFYTKSELKAIGQLYLVLLTQARPPLPIQGPIHLVIRYTFPFRMAERAGYRRQGFRLHDVRPDLDNLEKLLIDTMTQAKWFADDSQISIKISAKLWGIKPGIEIIAKPARAHWLEEHTDLTPLPKPADQLPTISKK